MLERAEKDGDRAFCQRSRRRRRRRKKSQKSRGRTRVTTRSSSRHVDESCDLIGISSTCPNADARSFVTAAALSATATVTCPAQFPKAGTWVQFRVSVRRAIPGLSGGRGSVRPVGITGTFGRKKGLRPVDDSGTSGVPGGRWSLSGG